MKKLNVGVAGASGLVGRKMVELLIKRQFPYSSITCWGSEKTAGESITIEGQIFKLSDLSQANLNGINLILSGLPNPVAEWFVPRATIAGCIVIDNSSRFRLDKNVPLVIPEVNGSVVTKHDKLIANPNCFTAGLVVALNPLVKQFGIEYVWLTAMGSVSGAGTRGLADLVNGIESFYDLRKPNHFPVPIADNIFPQIPQIDAFLSDGYTKEEEKIIYETQKILNLPNLPIAVTAVRVPVRFGHSLAVTVRMRIGASVQDIISALKTQPRLEVREQPKDFPHPLEARNTDPVYVGRIRVDRFDERLVHLWVVSDNLMKGAALNAVHIAEELVNGGFLNI